MCVLKSFQAWLNSFKLNELKLYMFKSDQKNIWKIKF